MRPLPSAFPKAEALFYGVYIITQKECSQNKENII